MHIIRCKCCNVLLGFTEHEAIIIYCPNCIQSMHHLATLLGIKFPIKIEEVNTLRNRDGINEWDSIEGHERYIKMLSWLENERSEASELEHFIFNNEELKNLVE